MYHLRSQLVQTECIGERLTGRVKNKRDLSVSQWKPEFKIFTFIAPSLFLANLWPSVVQIAAAQLSSFWQARCFKAVPPPSVAHLEKILHEFIIPFLMRSSKTCWKYLWRLFWSCQSQGQQDAPWIPCQWSLCLAWSPCNQLYWTFSLEKLFDGYFWNWVKSSLMFSMFSGLTWFSPLPGALSMLEILHMLGWDR